MYEASVRQTREIDRDVTGGKKTSEKCDKTIEIGYGGGGKCFSGEKFRCKR